MAIGTGNSALDAQTRAELVSADVASECVQCAVSPVVECVCALQQDWAALLSQVEDSYEVVDTVPLPTFVLSEGRKARQRHWLWDSRFWIVLYTLRITGTYTNCETYHKKKIGGQNRFSEQDISADQITYHSRLMGSIV